MPTGGRRQQQAKARASGAGQFGMRPRQGTIGGSKPPRPEQFFERELGHRKLDVHFVCFRRASSMIPKEIATQSAKMLRNPFHRRGRAAKGRLFGFFGQVRCQWSKAGANALFGIKCYFENNCWPESSI